MTSLGWVRGILLRQVLSPSQTERVRCSWISAVSTPTFTLSWPDKCKQPARTTLAHPDLANHKAPWLGSIERAASPLEDFPNCRQQGSEQIRKPSILLVHRLS